jgi:glutathione S-transferase
VARELRRHGVEAEEIRVPYRRTQRKEVVALSGQRHVPLLILDGEAICDSRRIVEHLRWQAREKGQAVPRTIV